MRHDKLRLTIPWNEIEEGAQEQIKSVLEIPSLKKLAIMPDVHQGYTLPIGGVALMDGVISPEFVGVDIGCGMCAMITDIEYDIRDPDIIRKEIESRIPVGFNQRNKDLKYDNFKCGLMGRALVQKINAKVKNQLGTLGGGNHFIEVGETGGGFLAVVIHSGSRGAGKLTADFFTGMDEQFHSIDSVIGSAYFEAMNFMTQYALDNRMTMMEEIADVFGVIPESTQLINENHNFASIEPDGILHRKGATPAEIGQFGVIPGNMRDGTYITKGIGNEEFLCCASHGAGRRMSRGAARRKLDQSEFEVQMVGVSCETKKRLDESPGAYKDINEVIRSQDGILVDVIDHIAPRIVVKG